MEWSVVDPVELPSGRAVFYARVYGTNSRWGVYTWSPIDHAVERIHTFNGSSEPYLGPVSVDPLTGAPFFGASGSIWGTDGTPVGTQQIYPANGGTDSRIVPSGRLIAGLGAVFFTRSLSSTFTHLVKFVPDSGLESTDYVHLHRSRGALGPRLPDLPGRPSRLAPF